MRTKVRTPCSILHFFFLLVLFAFGAGAFPLGADFPLVVEVFPFAEEVVGFAVVVTAVDFPFSPAR